MNCLLKLEFYCTILYDFFYEFYFISYDVHMIFIGFLYDFYKDYLYDDKSIGNNLKYISRPERQGG